MPQYEGVFVLEIDRHEFELDISVDWPADLHNGTVTPLVHCEDKDGNERHFASSRRQLDGQSVYSLYCKPCGYMGAIPAPAWKELTKQHAALRRERGAA